MGTGVVLSCHPERAGWLQANMGYCQRDEIFAAPAIALFAQYIAPDQQDLGGPDVKYACSHDTFRPADAPGHVAITVVEGDRITDLYRYQGFREALHYRSDHPRPDMAATVASRAGNIVGIAGAKADCELMWQIGVEVIGLERGKGIGRALVSRLTEIILQKGKIPYYSAAVSNIHSRAIATGLGYWPIWTELYVRDRANHGASRNTVPHEGHLIRDAADARLWEQAATDPEFQDEIRQIEVAFPADDLSRWDR